MVCDAGGEAGSERGTDFAVDDGTVDAAGADGREAPADAPRTLVLSLLVSNGRDGQRLCKKLRRGETVGICRISQITSRALQEYSAGLLLTGK